MIKENNKNNKDKLLISNGIKSLFLLYLLSSLFFNFAASRLCVRSIKRGCHQKYQINQLLKIQLLIWKGMGALWGQSSLGKRALVVM